MYSLHRLWPIHLAILGATAWAQVPKDPLVPVAWLAGAWSGQIGRAEIEEQWLPPKGGVMVGMGRTVVAGRLASFEFLRIEQRAGEVYYVAQPQGRPGTDFKLTSAGDSRVVFENPQHDFPQVITYAKEDGETLVATLTGEEGGRRKTVTIRLKRSR